MKTKILFALGIVISLFIGSHVYIGKSDELPYEQKVGTLYIEVCNGIVKDGNGNGQITSTYDEFYNYISYSSDGFQKGDKVTSIFLYNPLTTWNDDIILRLDF